MLSLMFAAALATGAVRIPAGELQILVAEAEHAEVRHRLPEGLLTAVALAESGGRNVVVRRRCGWDVGVAQVHVCERALGPARARERLQRLLVLSANLDASAGILARSRATCTKHPWWRACGRSRWALYNAHSTEWWPRVRAIWRRLRWHHDAEV